MYFSLKNFKADVVQIGRFVIHLPLEEEKVLMCSCEPSFFYQFYRKTCIHPYILLLKFASFQRAEVLFRSVFPVRLQMSGE